jgi:bacterioferritin-associated ferredoxin
MIVCLCKGVSSHQILSEVRRGNCTVKGIAQACEAGTSCGMCVRQIRELIGISASPARSRSDATTSARGR